MNRKELIETATRIYCQRLSEDCQLWLRDPDYGQDYDVILQKAIEEAVQLIQECEKVINQTDS